MALVNWDPFAELDALRNQLDNWPSIVAASQPALQLAPVTDIFTEDDKQLSIEVHLPNFAEKEVSIDVHEKALEIKAKHFEKEEDKKKRNYLVRESSQSFYRRIALPKQADEDNIKAHFSDGVLKVTVPFKELPKPKKISISAGKKEK